MRPQRKSGRPREADAQCPDQSGARLQLDAGFYVGAHAGDAWGTTESTAVLGGALLGAPAGFNLPVSSQTFNGFLGGFQGGYNWDRRVGPQPLARRAAGESSFEGRKLDDARGRRRRGERFSFAVGQRPFNKDQFAPAVGDAAEANVRPLFDNQL